MTFILTSFLRFCYRDEDNDLCPTAIGNKNNIRTNIKKHILKSESIVIISNDPNDYERNDEVSSVLLDSFKLSGMQFKTVTVLDNRTKKHAKEIVKNADLIILLGGEIISQIKFFNKIKLGKLFKKHSGLVIGISAGAMNLCKDVYNFPEEESEFDQPRWVKGIGVFDSPYIPHFDGRRKKYQNSDDEFDVVKDYILPASSGKEFIGQPNDSYILINDGKAQYYGTHYLIKNGKVEKFSLFSDAGAVKIV